ncbi:MAG: protease inhibitor I42 family protein [Thermomicrobiales bacterium]
MSRIVLTADDNGSTRRIRIGDVIELRLDENPTTGYRWTLPSPDPAIIVIEDDAFARAGQGIGSGGERTILMSAHGQGRARLECEQVRSWEPDQPISRFSVTIVIDA